MKVTRRFVCIAMCLVMFQGARSLAEPVATVFNYQGQLKVGDVPHDGRTQFVFSLWDSRSGGRELAPAVPDELVVVNGLFSANLDFGTAPFRGQQCWLQVAVDLGRGPIDLTPRQAVTPAPYAMTALQTVGVDGHSLNAADGDPVDALFVDDAGNVGIGTTSPRSKLDVEGTIETSALRLTSAPTNGYVLTTDAAGNGSWQAPPTGSDSLWLENRNDIYYSAGNVGIGTTAPEAMLDVAGVLAVDGFQMGDRIPSGHVLTANASGYGTWQAPPVAADPVWAQSGSDIYYDGQVGIGTTDPQYPLEVVGFTAPVLKVLNTSSYGQFAAIHGEAESPDGLGVKGMAISGNGDNIGVYGHSNSATGKGVSGVNTAGGYGVYGQGQSSSAGWAGYFLGRGHFSGNVGIGTTSPQDKLDVNGTVKMNSIKIGTSTTAGHVLTASSNGTGTWQAAPTGGGGFNLPVAETVDVDGDPALKITNTGSGIGTYAIRAIINSANTDEAAAGSFRTYGSGNAVSATSDSGTAVYASGDGIAVYGTTSGTGGGSFRSTQAGGYGVKGRATSTAADLDTIGGWFESSGETGSAVYAKATGVHGKGLKVETTGAESYAIDATSPWYGMYVSGGLKAARFYGKIDVKSRTSNSVVFSVGNDGMTTVDVLHIAGGSDLAEKFDIVDAARPGMVVEIDPDRPGKLRIARGAYNRRVAGVISGANDLDVGMVLADLPGADNSMPVALSGRVWVYCDASTGAISPGDLLTTSDHAGHAMAVRDHSEAVGAMIGKAMTALDEGETGMVLVLVNLQ